MRMGRVQAFAVRYPEPNKMYGTSRVCPMCQAGAYWAGLSRLWYGESNADGGAPRLS